MASTGRGLTFVDRRTMIAVGATTCAAPVRALSVSEDDRLVFAAMSGAVNIVDIADRLVLAELPTSIEDPYWVWKMEDRLLVSGTEQVQAWTLREPSAAPGVPVGSRMRDLDGPVFYYTNTRANNEVHTLDWTTGHHASFVLAVPAPLREIHQAGRALVSLHDDGTVVTWSGSARSWTRIDTRVFDPDLRCLQTAPTGRVAVWAQDGKIRVFNGGDSRQHEHELQATRPVVCSTLAFSPDGHHLVAAGSTLRLWDLREEAAAAATIDLDVGSQRIRAVEFGASSDALYVAGDFGVQEVFRDGSLGRRLSTENRSSLEYGDGLLVARRRQEFDAWQMPAGRRVLSVRAQGALAPMTAAIEPGGKALRLVGPRVASRLPIAEHSAAEGGELLAAAARAAGHGVEQRGVRDFDGE